MAILSVVQADSFNAISVYSDTAIDTYQGLVPLFNGSIQLSNGIFKTRFILDAMPNILQANCPLFMSMGLQGS